MPKFKLQTRQINKKGKLAWEYNPLYNLVKSNECVIGEETFSSLSTFDTKDITFDINHPVDIECQPSYDGSVNLILNDDMNVPRIVNSGFTLLEDNSFERVSRNQVSPTNIYKNANLETMLQRCINIHMISTSEIKVSVLVDERDSERAVQAIHDRFFNYD